MIKNIINKCLVSISEFNDDEDLAVYVSESLEMEDYPEWVLELVQEIRSSIDEDPSIILVDACKDSWLEDLSEKYTEYV